MKVFFVYIILLAFFTTITIITFYLIKSQFFYSFVVRVYVIFEYCILSIFFYNLYTNRIAKRIIIYSIIPFVIYSSYNLIIIERTGFNNNSLVLEFLAFIIFIIYFFYEKMKTVVLYPLYQSITFWICVGLFLYFTGNFFFILFIKSTTDKELRVQMKIIYSFVTITKNIFLSMAFFATEISDNTSEEFSIPEHLNLDDLSPNNLN